MLHVIVVCGGWSLERDVSLRSGAAAAKALKTAGYKTNIIDPKDGFKAHEITLKKADVVFPVLHGEGGEDGQIQAVLERLGVPYVGSDAQTSAVCADKQRAKERFMKAGVTTPAGEVVTLDTIWESRLADAPFVVKPIGGGSTIDTFIVRDPAEADKLAIEQALRQHKHMLLEALIEGVELTVAVLGNRALTPIEIIPPSGGEFDYENKYNGKTAELCPPEHITAAQQATVQKLAVQIHNLLGCRDLSRSDFILDASGTFYALETNTLPGMTSQSLYPKAAQASGIGFTELVDRLTRMALARRKATA